MEGIIITEKDKKVLDFLYKFRLATSIELSVLLNVSNSGVYKRMKRLERVGLVKKQRHIILEYSYFLSSQGHVFLNGEGKEIDLLTLNFFHELFISKIGVILLRDNKDLKLKDIYTEKDQFSLEESFFKSTKKSFPDLFIPKYKLIIEYERTEKSKERIVKKIENNFINFADCKQIWILPETRITTIELLEINDFYISGIITERYINDALKDNKHTLILSDIIKPSRNKDE